ncbi:hypothetical protein LSH36_66g01025 [Paralvinella palmiformis]|uniref:Glycosyltransferase n=1 Tax=Paralvinella palmiformis TaxID=53620 RepID=A0AAD9K3M0_9ANNE|nr:hypothetical protein LSH36_66g01025 [Paralvinella palmiformis]
MFGVSFFGYLFRKGRKNIYIQLLTAACFVYCIFAITVLVYDNQSRTLTDDVEQLPAFTQTVPRLQHEYHNVVQQRVSRTQDPVDKINHNNDLVKELMTSKLKPSDRIINRLLTAFREYPTKPPERAHRELDHIQDILNRFREGEGYYYMDQYDDVDGFKWHRSRDLIDLVKGMSDRGCHEYERAAAMRRLIVPDILDHAQYISENSEFVSLIAHMTEDRLTQLDNLLQHWNGPVSIALYINIAHIKDFITRLLDIEGLQNREGVLLHVVPQEGVIYPINYLRNVAINNTKTRYIFFSDIDFIPVVGSHNILLEDLQTTKGQKQVYVIPAFEEKHPNTYQFPQSKDDLIPLLEKGLIVPFHLDKFAPGHHRTDFKKWKSIGIPYQIEWEPLFEPYVAGEREYLPRYSEMFVGRGMNKIQHIVEIVAMGLVLA